MKIAAVFYSSTKESFGYFCFNPQRALMQPRILILLLVLLACNAKTDVKKITLINENGKETALLQNVNKYPDSSILVEDLIQYYREAGNFDQAIATTQRYISTQPNNARWWDIQATLLYENEDTLKAIESFEKALSIFPDPQYVISLGTLYASTGNIKALEMADALIIATKADAQKEAYFIKGLYYANTKAFARAVDFFDKCLNLNYTFMSAYIEKALALDGLSKYEAALQVLEKAILVQNNFDEAYFYRGYLLEKLNRKPEAAEAYKSALMYSPDYTEAKAALAKLTTQ